MTTLFWIILTTLATTMISLVGVVTLLLKESVLRRITVPLVALSAGALLGGAMLHLIPESLEAIGDTHEVMLWTILGFVIFLILEQFIHWHHCHKMVSEHKHPVTYLILISDAVHNFIDGVVIGAAFLVSVPLGIATTLAVIAHEIPQELGDFGVLIHGGWKRSQAIIFNFLSGVTMMFGGVLVWFLSEGIDVKYLLPFAAGNFIYIATADLVPEFKGCMSTKKNLFNFIFFIFGIFLMYSLLFLEVN